MRSRLSSKSGTQPNNLWHGGLYVPEDCKSTRWSNLHPQPWMELLENSHNCQKVRYSTTSDLLAAAQVTPTIPPEVVDVKGCVLDKAVRFGHHNCNRIGVGSML